MNKKLTKLLSIIALCGVIGVGAGVFAGCNNNNEDPNPTPTPTPTPSPDPGSTKAEGYITFSGAVTDIPQAEAEMATNVSYTADSVITGVKVSGDDSASSSGGTQFRTGQGTASINLTDYTVSFNIKGSSLQTSETSDNFGRIYKRYLAVALDAAGSYEVTVYARGTHFAVDNAGWDAPQVCYDAGTDSGTNVKAYTLSSVTVASTNLVINIGGDGALDIFGVKVKSIPTVAATTISLNKTTTTIAQGNQEQLTASMNAGATDYVTWKSSDETKVEVDGSGKITAKAAGTATVTATARTGVTASCIVTVTEAAGASGTYTIDYSTGAQVITPNANGISVIAGEQCVAATDNTFGQFMKFAANDNKGGTLTVQLFGLKAGQTISLTIKAADFSGGTNGKDIDCGIAYQNATGSAKIQINGESTEKSTDWEEKTITVTVSADGSVSIILSRTGGGTLILQKMVVTVNAAA